MLINGTKQEIYILVRNNGRAYKPKQRLVKITGQPSPPAPHLLWGNPLSSKGYDQSDNLRKAEHAFFSKLLNELLNSTARPPNILTAIAEQLTEREKEVLFAFLSCPRNKMLAKRFGTKEQTIRNQLAAIRKKLEVASLIDLVANVLLAIFQQHIRQPRD